MKTIIFILLLLSHLSFAQEKFLFLPDTIPANIPYGDIDSFSNQPNFRDFYYNYTFLTKPFDWLFTIKKDFQEVTINVNSQNSIREKHDYIIARYTNDSIQIVKFVTNFPYITKNSMTHQQIMSKKLDKTHPIYTIFYQINALVANKYYWSDTSRNSNILTRNNSTITGACVLCDEKPIGDYILGMYEYIIDWEMEDR